MVWTILDVARDVSGSSRFQMYEMVAAFFLVDDFVRWYSTEKRVKNRNGLEVQNLLGSVRVQRLQRSRHLPVWRGYQHFRISQGICVVNVIWGH